MMPYQVGPDLDEAEARDPAVIVSPAAATGTSHVPPQSQGETNKRRMGRTTADPGLTSS